MLTKTRTFAPILTVLFIYAATNWIVLRPAPDAAQDGVATGIVSASFEYFPAQFSSAAAEIGDPIPTF